jgi:hypothetical protein
MLRRKVQGALHAIALVRMYRDDLEELVREFEEV